MILFIPFSHLVIISEVTFRIICNWINFNILSKAGAFPSEDIFHNLANEQNAVYAEVKSQD